MNDDYKHVPLSTDNTLTQGELPKCPRYIAHPQAVWFETHWRPAYERVARERDELLSKFNGTNALAELFKERDRYRQALEWIIECDRRLRGNELANEPYVQICHEYRKVGEVARKALEGK